MLVPMMALDLVGVARIIEPARSLVFMPLALIDTFTMAVLLFTGDVEPRQKARTCHWCDGFVIPDVSAWRCNKCGHVDRREDQQPANPVERTP